MPSPRAHVLGSRPLSVPTTSSFYVCEALTKCQEAHARCGFLAGPRQTMCLPSRSSQAHRCGTRHGLRSRGAPPGTDQVSRARDAASGHGNMQYPEHTAPCPLRWSRASGPASNVLCSRHSPKPNKLHICLHQGGRSGGKGSTSETRKLGSST